MNAQSCELESIIQCPERVRHLPHFDLLPRFAQTLATYALVFALSSIRAAHRTKALNARRRRAKFVAFERRQVVLPASASVQL